MDKDEATAWAKAFNHFGDEQLLEILKRALQKTAHDDERFIVEFRDDNAVEITEHVERLESDL